MIMEMANLLPNGGIYAAHLSAHAYIGLWRKVEDDVNLLCLISNFLEELCAAGDLKNVDLS